MDPKRQRACFAATAACVTAGVVISVFTAAHNTGQLAPGGRPAQRPELAALR